MSPTTKKPKAGPPTSQYLPLSEIRDNTVIMKDESLRAVLLCSSVNFSLKSETEQQATISAYMAFLNSVDFPIQIVIQSRRLNIDAYLERLQNMEREQPNELLRVQITDYLAYIKELISLGQIMTKRFYVAIPYYPGADKKRGMFKRMLTVLSTASAVKMSREQFATHTEALDRRVDYVMSGLTSMGLNAVRLDTQGLIELYYNTYNPEVMETEKMVEVEKLQLEQV